MDKGRVIKFSKTSRQSYSFKMLITAACSTFDLASIRWNWFCSSSVQHSIEMLCLILILWYNCLYRRLCCVLCTQCFQWISGYLKTYKPCSALPSPCEHHSYIINCYSKLEDFSCEVVIMQMCSLLLSCGMVLLLFSLTAASRNLCPLARASFWAVRAFFWFFPFLFCHCS